MRKKQYMSDEEFEKMLDNMDLSKPDEEQLARDAYFNDPANAEEIAEQQAKMDLVIALYNARHDAGLTQQQLAEKLGTSQVCIAQIERGRRNPTFSTIQRYAAACGKKIALTLL